jgi:hypothetical protein
MRENRQDAKDARDARGDKQEVRALSLRVPGVFGVLAVISLSSLSSLFAGCSSGSKPGALGNDESPGDGGDAAAADTGTARDTGADAGADSANDASTTDSAPVACMSEDGGCNSLTLCGPEVAVVQVESSVPVGPAGGTILDGTYEMVSYQYFIGDAGPQGGIAWFRQTFSLVTAPPDGGGPDGGPSAPQFQWEQVVESDSSPLSTVAGTVSVPSAQSVTFASQCPSITAVTLPYTATATDLIVFQTDPAGVALIDFKRQ